jgi:glycine dehydrogenase subunit 1
MMANRVTRRTKVVLSGGLHAHYAQVCRTYGAFTGFDCVTAPPDPTGREDLASLVTDDVSCVVVQNPNAFGHVRDLAPLVARCREKGALLVAVVTEVVSLGLLRSPGAMGADVAACEGQSLGNPLNFGGPHVGLFATKEAYLRQMPGRLCGETRDADGRRGFVLTLSTREQHIRREKATSNICTNSGLCALAFSIHLSLLGEEGFRHLARLNHVRAVQLADKLAMVKGVDVLTPAFFNEFVLKLPKPAAAVVEALVEKGVLAGVPAARLWPEAGLDDLLLVAATECNTESELDSYARALAEVL